MPETIVTEKLKIPTEAPACFCRDFGDIRPACRISWRSLIFSACWTVFSGFMCQLAFRLLAASAYGLHSGRSLCRILLLKKFPVEAIINAFTANLLTRQACIRYKGFAPADE